MRVSAVLPALALIPTTFGQLNKLTKLKGGRYYGSATDNPELTDAPYVAILSDTDEFGQITPGNSQKWESIEPSQNTFSYTRGDVIADLAEANGQLLRCHTLVWHSQLPSWVSGGTWTNATLIAAMKNHIANVATHYKGRCFHWDVVNEAFNEDGTYRPSVFYNTIGPEYIPIAFETARQYDPTAKLYINDYNLEYGGAKYTATLNLVASLIARGIPIDGVGFQAHMIVGNTPGLSALTSRLASFAALGVDVAYTEVDVRFGTLPPTTAGLAQQTTDYNSLLGSCLAVARCVGFTIWDFTDKYSWIPSTFSGQGAALPWWEDFTKKPAYYGMISLLGGGASSTSTVASSTTFTTSTISSTIATTSKPATYTSKSSSSSSRSSIATTTSAATGVTIPKWGQCGGQGWGGPYGHCVAGTTCKYQNDWYSQCL